MTRSTATRLAAALGFLAVCLGAFGAHALKPLLEHNGTTEIWEKAVFYHFIHTVMLYVTAQKQPLPGRAVGFFLAGVFIFSGSLYLLAVTRVLWLGAVTPLGGLCLLAGWAALFWRAARD